jgi:hypothetical protein
LPFCDEPVQDIRVTPGKILGDRRSLSLEDQHGAVDRFGERAAHEQLASFVSGVRVGYVLLAVRSTPLHIVVDGPVAKDGIVDTPFTAESAEKTENAPRCVLW